MTMTVFHGYKYHMQMSLHMNRGCCDIARASWTPAGLFYGVSMGNYKSSYDRPVANRSSCRRYAAVLHVTLNPRPCSCFKGPKRVEIPKSKGGSIGLGFMLRV